MAFDSKRALNHAIKYLTESAHQRAAGGWIPPKEKERRKKEAAKSEEKQQKLLSKQFPTHYMPNVGRQVMQTGGVPEEQKESLQPTPQTVPQPTPQTAQPNQTYGLGQQLQRGTEMASRIPSSVNRLFVEPITTGISELMRPVYQGGDASSYQNPEMVGRAIDVVGGLGAGSMMIGPSAAQTNVLRSGMGPVAREVIAQPQRQLSPLGFYSAAAERASALQPSGDAAQMIAALKNTQGLKTEELMNAGLIDAAGNVNPEWAGRGKVTREDLVSHLQGQMPQVEETVLGYNRNVPGWEIVNQDNRYMLRRPDGSFHTAPNSDIPATWSNETAAQAALNFNAKDSSSATKYSQYTLPGGENYREVLLRLKPEMRDLTMDEVNAARQKISPMLRPLTEEEYAKELSKGNIVKVKKNPNAPIFQSSHFPDPDILAHIRMADRTGPNGEKILHVEELQSDWGQKGKKKGFLTDEMKRQAEDAQKNFSNYANDLRLRYEDSLIDQTTETPVEMQKQLIRKITNQMTTDDIARKMGEYEKFNNLESKSYELENSLKGLPSAPYVTSTEGWTDLALKRVLKEAAEGGYDKVVWTPGAEQAKRYDLSEKIGQVVAHPTPDGRIEFEANSPDMSSVVYRGIHKPEELDNIVGKEVADKIRSQIEFPKQMEGYHVVNKISGNTSALFPTMEEAKNNFSMYPERMKKDLEIRETNKKTKGKPVTLNGLDLAIGGEGMKGYYDSIVPKRLQNIAKKYDKNAKLGYTETHHRGQVSNAPISYTLPSLDITPAMRESILRGQPAYKRGGRVPPDLKMNVPIKGTKERMSNRRADVPVRWASSPDHPSAHLAYITDAEAKLLKKADLHNSNIAHEHHVGPGGIPSYQGGGIGSGGSTNTSGGPGSAPGGDGSTSGSSGMGAGTGNISSSGGGGGGGGAAITTGGGGRDSSPSISRGGGGGGGMGGIGLGSVNAFGSPGNMGTFGSMDPGQQADQSMVDALSSNMSLGANLGSSLVQEAVTPDLSGGSDIMSPQNLGIQNGVLMGGITPAAYGRMQSQPQMLQAMGIAGAPTTAADLSLAAQAARLGDIPGAAQAEAAPKPEAVNPITGATTPGGQALSETQWSNLGKPWAQAATDIANWIGAGFKTPEVPAPAPQPSVPFVKEQGAAPGSPSASITPQGTGLSGFEAALGTTPTATGQINVPNAGDLYGASNAPLAVNQQSAPSTSTPQSLGMQDPSQAAYAEQMAKSAREAWLAANTEPESPRLGDLATPTLNRPFATPDRAGSIGSMPIGMTPRTADLTPMSSQPSRPITPTPFSTFPQDVQRQMIPNRPDSAFGQTLVDPTGEQTQQALGNMEIAENGLALLQNPIVRMFMPTPTPATPEQQSAIERMYQRDLNSGVPSDFATPEGMLSRYGYPTGTTPDRAGSMGSMPSGTMQYDLDLTPMSNQPARPTTPTPSTAYPTSSPQVQQQQQSSQAKTGAPEYSSSLQPSQTIRQNFEQAFADARAKNAPTFYWTNPATGERTLYTTQLGRKEGGRVPSLSNPNDWVAKPSKVTAPSKKTSSRKPSKIDGTAIVRRALMLSSRKS